MRKAKVSVALLILTVGLLTSQINFVSAQTPQKHREATVKKEGWVVPGRNDFKQESKIIEKNIEGVNITQKILKAPNEIVVDLSGKTVAPFVKRESDIRLFSVRTLIMYESDGRVFAFEVDLVPVFFIRGKNYWQKVYAGAIYNIFYVDEDGDGIYESRYGGFSLPKLPEWVRRNV